MSCEPAWPQSMASKHDCKPTKNLSLAEIHSEPMSLKVKTPEEAPHMEEHQLLSQEHMFLQMSSCSTLVLQGMDRNNIAMGSWRGNGEHWMQTPTPLRI